MSDNDAVEVVRHGVDNYGTPFTSTFRLLGATDGEIRLGRVDGGQFPPCRTYAPADFVEAGFHLKADCPHFEDGEAIHLRDDFDGDFGAIPDCDRPVYSFSSVEEPALE